MKIGGINAPQELPDAGGHKPGKTGGTSFGDTLNEAIQQVSSAQQEAETAIRGIALGDGTDVHTAMLAMQKADMSFQMMMQVRNKLITAYEEIMRMQV
ncbi:MAG: flagellar hook-basal body complex protein FliE [Nitrospirae bacterium]|nr:flagellar hook-basal body complex protein FliE [Nitrospirota bacterium]